MILRNFFIKTGFADNDAKIPFSAEEMKLIRETVLCLSGAFNLSESVTTDTGK